MKLNFGLAPANRYRIYFLLWLLDKEEQQYKCCSPRMAKRIEKRIKYFKKKLLKKL